MLVIALIKNTFDCVLIEGVIGIGTTGAAAEGCGATSSHRGRSRLMLLLLMLLLSVASGRRRGGGGGVRGRGSGGRVVPARRLGRGARLLPNAKIRRNRT